MPELIGHSLIMDADLSIAVSAEFRIPDTATGRQTRDDADGHY
ncbi:hypothetical protein ACPZ19_50120 [Amycolatopsis lurida]